MFSKHFLNGNFCNYNYPLILKFNRLGFCLLASLNCLVSTRRFLLYVLVLLYIHLVNCKVMTFLEGHKIGKNLPLVLTFSISADLSKQEGDFFKFLWPFQKS